MKIIDVDDFAFCRMTKAPIGEKNVCSDVLLDAIYDNSSYTENNSTSVGFINGYPTFVGYSGCSMEINFNSPYITSDDIKKEWMLEIVERLTGIQLKTKQSHLFALDEESGLVYSINLLTNMIIIAIKFYQQ